MLALESTLKIYVYFLNNENYKLLNNKITSYQNIGTSFIFYFLLLKDLLLKIIQYGNSICILLFFKYMAIFLI